MRNEEERDGKKDEEWPGNRDEITLAAEIPVMRVYCDRNTTVHFDDAFI